MEGGNIKQLRRWKWTPVKNKETKSVEDLDKSVGADTGRTCHTTNGRGYSFNFKSSSTSHWMSSLPESSAPLVDLGAGFGFAVAEAIKSGRDVVAVDCEQLHLEKISEIVRNALTTRASEAEMVGTNLPGKLLDLKLSVLPEADLFGTEEVAGVLLAHVLHFLKPGEPLQMFHDVFRWLQPGALFVVTTISCAGLEFLLSVGSKLSKPRSMDDLWHFLQNALDEEIIEECPTYVMITNDMIKRRAGPHLICFSTNELRALARLAGFEIIALEYEQPPDFAFAISQTDMTTILVARKPIDASDSDA